MLSDPLNVDGGKVIIERLLHLFNLRSKVELSGIIGVSTGSIATWQTRSTVPYELLIRIHLATGVSMEYLLFDRVVGDINAMQYCPDPSVKPSYATINQNLNHFRFSLCEPAHYDAGEQIIKRLIKVLNVTTKAEFSKVTSVSIGTLATWHTRKVTPYELLCRIHLATGVSMHFLCFGREWEPKESRSNQISYAVNEVTSEYSDIDVVKPCANTFILDNGNLITKSKYIANAYFWSNTGISPDSDVIVISDNKSYFINKKSSTVSKGFYLFSVNNVHQIGELRQLPDGKIYFFDGDDKCEINHKATNVHGKVVSILESV